MNNTKLIRDNGYKDADPMSTNWLSRSSGRRQRRCILLKSLVWAALAMICSANGEMNAPGDEMRYLEVTAAVLNEQVIQLVVNWEGAQDLGRNVDLTVRTDGITDLCPRVTCQRFGIDAERGKWTLPETINYVEEPRECEFYPGCSYQVLFRYEDSGVPIFRNLSIPGN